MAAHNGALKKEWITAEDLSLTEVKDNGFWDRLDPLSRIRMSIGLAWEQWYIPQLDGVLDHPGEMCVDGIFMTHDGESLDMVLHQGRYIYIPAVHEVKATYKSINTIWHPQHGLETAGAWMWITQLKAYCKGLDTNIGYIHGLFLCGDYARPIQPQLRVWRIAFTQAEIDTRWDEIVAEVKHWKALQENND